MSWQYDHTHFKCSDYEKTVAFFKENFGAKEVTRWENKGMPIVTVQMGGLSYNFSPRRSNETVDARTDTVHYGVYHIALQTADLVAEVAKMKQRGVKVTQDVGQANPKTKFAFIEGPDGISIELLQRD
jgi:lactoylglutathione lyase